MLYVFYAFYVWWIHFPQLGALAEGTSLPTSPGMTLVDRLPGRHATARSRHMAKLSLLTAAFYAFHAFYAWWIHFPQLGALTEGTSQPTSCKHDQA